MNTLTATPITMLIGALLAQENGRYFWLPEEPANKLQPYATFGLDLTAAVQEICNNPQLLDETVGDRRGRALVYQACRAMVMAAGYRAHGLLSRINIGNVTGDGHVEAQFAKYKEWATGREPGLETFLLGGTSDGVRRQYKDMVAAGAGRDDRLSLLLENHRYSRDAMVASWGLIHAQNLSDCADANGQLNPMLDNVVLNRSWANVQILDQVTHGLMSMAKKGMK